MFALGLACLVLSVAPVDSHLGALGPKNVSQKDAEFEHTYVDEVNSELVNIYTFNHTVTRNRVRAGAGWGLRFCPPPCPFPEGPPPPLTSPAAGVRGPT